MYKKYLEPGADLHPPKRTRYRWASQHQSALVDEADLRCDDNSQGSDDTDSALVDEADLRRDDNSQGSDDTDSALVDEADLRCDDNSQGSDDIDSALVDEADLRCDDNSQGSDDTDANFSEEIIAADTQSQCSSDCANQATHDTCPGSPFAFKEPPDFNCQLTDGTNTTGGEAVSLIMAYALRHHLSATAKADLLKLVNVLFGKEVVPDTPYLFNKIIDIGDKIRINVYCMNCNSPFGLLNNIHEANIICHDCGHLCDTRILAKSYYYISIPLGSQLQALLENDDISAKIIDRNDRSPQRNCVKDIYDSALYRKLMTEGSVLSNSYNYSYTFSTDGASVFKSSGFAIWPIHVCLNELPPRERIEHTLLAGLWFGQKAPDMSVFLQSFVEDATLLATEGIKWRSRDGDVYNSKFIPLVSAVDSVARPLLQNMVQYNGKFGCCFCLHPGKQVKRGNGTSHVYPIQIVQERSEQETLRHMHRAVCDGRIKGVKGPSVLINLPYFNIISGFTPEYMHCVLLGVIRQVTNIFLDSVGNGYYIGAPRTIATVNSRLTQITPVSEITRCPRPLSDVKYWKASEWKSWLLFYCIPCLKNVIPNRHLKHLSLLSKAVFLLLKEIITFDEINLAHALLLEFVGKMEILYGEEECTFNVHLLTHLAKAVKNWGPLWAQSAFGFESANGRLTKLIEGTQFIPKQIVNKFILNRALPMIVKHVQMSSTSEEMYNHLTQHNSNSSVKRTHDGAVMLGRPLITCPSAAEATAFCVKGIDPPPNEIHVYKRMIYKHQVLHSVEYTRATKRNDSVIFVDKKYCRIVKLVTYIEQERVNTVLFLRQLIRSPQPMLVPHIHAVTGEVEDIVVVSLNALEEKCIYFSTGGDHFVCHLPNTYERD